MHYKPVTTILWETKTCPNLQLLHCEEEPQYFINSDRISSTTYLRLDK